MCALRRGHTKKIHILEGNDAEAADAAANSARVFTQLATHGQ